MEIIQSIILGIVQGIGEFLPISSSAHLILVPYLFGFPEHSLAFDVALHFGTLIAVLTVFYKEREMGLEPTAYWLRISYSTNWVIPAY